MAAAPTVPARKVRLTEDRRYLRTTIPVNFAGWTVAAPVRLDSRSADALLAGIGRQRAQMAEQHPLQLTTSVTANAVPDPYWMVSRSSLTEGVCLSVRHPGFGWLQFELTTHEATRLARNLVTLVKAPR